jgi:alkylhydroperoxidase/carboxymuconolactone decarboxylase family protein YurZ
MMTEEEIIEHGREMFEKCYNGVIPLPGPVAPDSFGELNLKLFHEVWGDDRLSFRDKRLIVIGVMGGRAGSPEMFAIHARSALKNGELTVDELRASMKVLLNYAGAPATSPLYLALEKIIKETEGESTKG